MWLLGADTTLPAHYGDTLLASLSARYPKGWEIERWSHRKFCSWAVDRQLLHLLFFSSAFFILTFLDLKWFSHFLPDLTGTLPPEGSHAFPTLSNPAGYLYRQAYTCFHKVISLVVPCRDLHINVKTQVAASILQENWITKHMSHSCGPRTPRTHNYIMEVHFSWTIGWIAVGLWTLCSGHICF